VKRENMSFISTAPERLTYFDLQLGQPDWQGRKVLDFGGNKGALLSGGKIEERNYWCIDVSRDAIAQGKREYPRAHWILYDRYNFAFNPTGVPGLAVPLLQERFDFILVYSVFTHTSRAEMLELVDVLRNLLLENGTLAFTFKDPHCVLPQGYSPLYRMHSQPTNLCLRLETVRQQNPFLPVERMLAEASGSEWCTLVNEDLYIEHENLRHYDIEERKRYDVFHTVRFMNKAFPDGVIKFSPGDYDPGGGEIQHCCVLRGRAGTSR